MSHKGTQAPAMCSPGPWQQFSQGSGMGSCSTGCTMGSLSVLSRGGSSLARTIQGALDCPDPPPPRCLSIPGLEERLCTSTGSRHSLGAPALLQQHTLSSISLISLGSFPHFTPESVSLGVTLKKPFPKLQICLLRDFSHPCY